MAALAPRRARRTRYRSSSSVDPAVLVNVEYARGASPLTPMEQHVEPTSTFDGPLQHCSRDEFVRARGRRPRASGSLDVGFGPGGLTVALWAGIVGAGERVGVEPDARRSSSAPADVRSRPTSRRRTRPRRSPSRTARSTASLAQLVFHFVDDPAAVGRRDGQGDAQRRRRRRVCLGRSTGMTMIRDVLGRGQERDAATPRPGRRFGGRAGQLAASSGAEPGSSDVDRRPSSAVLRRLRPASPSSGRSIRVCPGSGRRPARALGGRGERSWQAALRLASSARRDGPVHGSQRRLIRSRRRQPRSPLEQRLSLVTLGVADLARARRSTRRSAGGRRRLRTDDVVFFQAGVHGRRALGPRRLAEDTGVADAGGWGGITLAHNVRSPARSTP